jgi:carbonic anhydrase
MNTAKPIHIGKIIRDYDNLLKKGTQQTPLDQAEKIETMSLVIEELKVKYPKDVLKAFINTRKLQGLA